MEDHEGNMGLLDRMWHLALYANMLITRPAERLALAWVQKYIEEFCGDKSNVML